LVNIHLAFARTGLLRSWKTDLEITSRNLVSASGEIKDYDAIAEIEVDGCMQPSLGKMSAYKMLNWRDRAASSVEQTVAAFLEIGEAIATRWIQTAKGVLILQMVPDNGASGAIYVFDRQRELWHMLSFEGCEDQFTSEKFDRAFSEYDLFRLVEQPGLLLSEFQPATA
jgi:hypothetical protein